MSYKHRFGDETLCVTVLFQVLNNYLYYPDYIFSEMENPMIRDIKPALYGYVRDARSLLDPGSLPDERKVHDLRVLMKKSRAVIRLAGPQTENEFAEREYSVFRKTGRISATWRETSVNRKTLKNLKRNHPALFSRLAGFDKILNIMKKPGISGPVPEKTEADIALIRELLLKSAYRIRFQPMNNLDPVILLRQLDSSFKQVSDCYLAARDNPRSARLHELRKRCKDLLYQLWFFRPIKPGVVKNLEKRLETMTDNLGKYNDLAVLLSGLDYKYSPGKNPPAIDELAIVIRHEQDRLLSKVWPTAFRIFGPGKTLTSLLRIQPDIQKINDQE